MMKTASVHRVGCVHHYDRTEFYASPSYNFSQNFAYIYIYMYVYIYMCRLYISAFQQIFVLLFLTHGTVCLINPV
jgi:hypothetical protein